MTDEKRLKSLLSRAERAKKLADEIGVLQEHGLHSHGARLRFIDYNTNTDLYPQSVLETVFRLGRQALIDQKRLEMESVLDCPVPEPDRVLDNELNR